MTRRCEICGGPGAKLVRSTMRVYPSGRAALVEVILYLCRRCAPDAEAARSGPVSPPGVEG